MRLEIQTTYSPASFNESMKLIRRWPYWPVQFFGGFRAFTFVLAFFLFALRSLYLGVRDPSANREDLTSGLLILGLLAILTLWLLRRQTLKRRDAISKQAPLQLVLDDCGIAITRNQQSVHHPWSSFTEFYLRRSIIVLRRRHRNPHRFTTIPVDTLSSNQVGQLRSILLNYLPERPAA